MIRGREYVLKITNPEGSGTAFISVISGTDDTAYIITARHCLVHTNGTPFSNEELQVGFLTEGIWVEYQLKAEAKIFLGKDNETEDIGVIVIDKMSLPSTMDYSKQPFFCVPPSTGELVITGISKATNHELKRTLFRVKFLEDQDFLCQIQVEADDPMIKEYNADNLVEGYSGSPLMVESQGRYYICGIFIRFEEITRRILGVDLTLLNKLLSQAGYEPLKIVELETNPKIVSAINQLDHNTNRVLVRIRENIGTLHLERRNVCKQLKDIIDSSKLVIVTGVPGSGKSAVVKKVLSNLAIERTIIAVQGEQIDRSSLKEVFALAPFNIDVPIDEVLDSPACKSKIIILVDSVEKILETANAETILDFFELLHTRSDITLVLTCRSYAVEQLKIRFLQKFPAFPHFDVSLLDQSELDDVVQLYPQIKPLLTNASLSKILSIPFNLDKAVFLPASSFDAAITSEHEFGRIMWEYVIENHSHETNATIRRQRGELFMKIAVDRAVSMVPYVGVNAEYAQLLEQLVSDNILDREPVLGTGFAASHDIYEDWALTRHIHQKYLDIIVAQGDYQAFYSELGHAPALRRAFRLWFSEQIQQNNGTIMEMVTSTLTGAEIVNHWKDEILVAVMQSPFSRIFLDENADLIFDDKGKLLKRIVFLLQVACQQPDFSYLNQLKPEDRLKVYHNINLVPFGEGWQNVIDFLHSHLERLDIHITLLIRTLMEWEKGIKPYGELPNEARHAGILLLRYFKEFENGYSEEFPRSSNSRNIEDCILLLFRLSYVIKEESRDFIDAAFRFKETDNHSLENLHDKVIELVLSGDDDMDVCINYPQLVLEIAEDKWFYYRPTADEIKRQMAERPFYNSRNYGFDHAHDFGLKSSTGMQYFPASPEQTPILNLLFRRPWLTLPFLVKFLNHVADAFVVSEYGMNNEFLAIAEERSQILLKFDDGSENRQHASITLWTAFRGTYVAIPNLLVSVLMSLESYLLALGEVITKAKDNELVERYKKIFDLYFDTLLRQCNSVLASSVLLSVAQAYRDLAGEKIFPLLRNKEIYLWDRIRQVKERNVLSPISSGKNAFQKQKALREFQHLEHRKLGLPELVINLSFGKHANEVIEILDELRALEPDDDGWQIQVGNMDRRNFKITGEVENGLLVEAVHQGKLKAIVDEGKKEQEDHDLVSVAVLWSLKKLQNKNVENDRYDTWKAHYQVVQQAISDGKINMKAIQPGITAGIGLRDFLEQLSAEEKEWCVSHIMAILQYEIFNEKRYDFMHVQHTAFEKEVAFCVLPKLMHHSSEKEELRRYIFVLLIRYDDKFERKYLISSIHSFLWKADPDFMMDCIKGILQYSTIARLMSIQRDMIYRPGSPENFREFVVMLKEKSKSKWKNLIRTIKGQPKKKTIEEDIAQAHKIFEQIIERIGKDKLVLELNSFDFNNKSVQYLLGALKIIPRDTDREELRNYYLNLLRFVLENLENDTDHYGPNEKFHHELLLLLKKRVALFLLYQPKEIAEEAFKLLIGWSYAPDYARKFRDRKYDFVTGCLDEIMSLVIQDETKSEQFWQLWEYLINEDLKMKVAPFADKVLLNYMLFPSSVSSWEPFTGKGYLYKNYISKAFGAESAVRLIAGIGFKELVPEGLAWLADLLKAGAFADGDVAIYFEKIIIQCYYDTMLRKKIKSNVKLRLSFIGILDFLINEYGSSCSYIIREDFISLKS